jgi:hypothetical protein
MDTVWPCDIANYGNMEKFFEKNTKYCSKYCYMGLDLRPGGKNPLL